MFDLLAPAYGTGLKLTATTTSQATLLVSHATQCDTVCITNLSGTPIYIRMGTSETPAVTTSSYVVPAESQVTIRKNLTFDTILYIVETGTASFHVMLGHGA